MNKLKFLALGVAGLVGLASTAASLTGCTTDPETKTDTVVVIDTIPDTTGTGPHPFASISCLEKVNGVWSLKLDITASCELPGDSAYTLQGLTTVKSPANLTIGAGATVKGKYPGLSALIIDKGAKITAVGTAQKPIVFTSGRAAAQRGDFGGVILIGKGLINVPGGTSNVEGLTGVPYGGNDNADNSGELKYVRIEYAGYLLSPNNELNGLTMAAVGSGTKVSYVEVYEGFDDGFEWFGGAVSPHHLVVMGCDDDMFDWDFGWSGSAQFLLGVHNASVNNDANGIEADNSATGENDLPRSNPKLANVTLIGNNISVGNGSLYGMRLRRGTAGTLSNVLVTGFRASNGGRAVRIDGNNSIRLANNDSLKVQGLYAYANGGRTSFAPAAGLADSVNTLAALGTKVGTWFTTDTVSAGLVSSGYAVFKPTTVLGGSVTTPAGFTTANYIGAFDPSAAAGTLWIDSTAWFRKF